MIIKRLFDIGLSLFGLLVFTPLLIIICLLILLEDQSSPFYIAKRVGKNGTIFKMIKLRSLIKNADKSGVDSTSSYDSRITKVGRYIRRYKLDEISQLWNVLKGDMSLVGPRPNVEAETNIYSSEEKKILNIKPGITDFSSIIFSDEGEILSNYDDPDLAYNQIIRPWKSRLGILYIDKRSFSLDFKLILLTAIALISKKTSIKYIVNLLIDYNEDNKLIEACKREKKLQPFPPPGFTEIVNSR